MSNRAYLKRARGSQMPRQPVMPAKLCYATL